MYFLALVRAENLCIRVFTGPDCISPSGPTLPPPLPRPAPLLFSLPTTHPPSSRLEQLLLHVGFMETVKLHSIDFVAPADGETPWPAGRLALVFR